MGCLDSAATIPNYFIRDHSRVYNLASNASLAHFFGVATRQPFIPSDGPGMSMPNFGMCEDVHSQQAQECIVQAAANAWAVGAIFDCMVQAGIVQLMNVRVR